MTALALYKGRKGVDGTNGIDGLGSANTDDFTVDNPILDSLQSNSLAKNAFITLDRLSEGSYVDRYGNNRWADVATSANFVDYSEDFTQWTDTAGRWSIIGSTADPFGGSDATEINLDLDTDNPTFLDPVLESNENGWIAGGYVTISFWIKLISGTINSVDFGAGTTKYQVGELTGNWTRKVTKIAVGGTGFLASINPRGLTGARFGLYGVQIQSTNLTDYIKTTGSPNNANYETLISRQNNNGYLIEESKTNLIHHSNDFKNWTVTDGTIGVYSGKNPFGLLNQEVQVLFASLPTVTIETSTGTLTQGVEYNVSFYAFVGGGSLTSLSLTLGGGNLVVSTTPSVLGFERISLKATAGANSNIIISATSEALSALLYISNIQIETGELSSYFESGTAAQTRAAETVSMTYDYNYPAPNLPWSFIFKNGDIKNNSDVKTIFSNGLSGSDEFSLSYTGRMLTLTSGLNTSSFDTFDFNKVALTYDGTDLRVYNEQTLVNTDTVGSTSTIGTSAYLGYNGTDEYINGYLGKCMFYNVALTDNDIIYLMGA